MSLTNTNPDLDGFTLKVHTVVPDDATPAVAGQNVIPATARVVTVSAVTNDANDWIILPSLASVAIGHKITIFCSAGGNFELRTPASSAEEINSEDCDGTKEYLCTDTEILEVTKINNTIGWEAHSFSAIGAKTTAVVPD